MLLRERSIKQQEILEIEMNLQHQLLNNVAFNAIPSNERLTELYSDISNINILIERDRHLLSAEQEKELFPPIVEDIYGI